MLKLQRLWNERRDVLISAATFVLAFALYVRTLAPSVAFLFNDTLEFQYIVPRLGILHPTGYPFYTLLGKLFTLLVPLNDPAFRLNLLSALDGALAVAVVYLVIRHLVENRIAAVIGALTFAVGQTFWSQAVIAETYTTQMLIVAVLLYLTLIWGEEFQRGHADAARRRFYALLFVMGLGLAHHRLILLLYPAIAVYVLWTDRGILRDWKMLARAAGLFVAPLLLYLYLPLRGAVGSADGTYENTLSGFIAWVMADQYRVFLPTSGQNPFNIQRDTTYYWTLFQNQLSLVGLVLSAVGGLWLIRKPRELVFLVIALIAETAFAYNYRVANDYIYFLTTFLLLAIFAGAGVDALVSLVSRFEVRMWKPAVVTALLALALLVVPLKLLVDNYAPNDLSSKWDRHDYGLDILNQPLEKNATIIGIQGEMTLLRYFQETQGLRTDVQTVAADKEPARLAAVDSAIGQNRVVYLTRPLKDVEKKYSLSSLGPLIRVQPTPVTVAPKIAHPLEQDFGPVKLLGYDLDASRLESIPNLWHVTNGRFLRVTLYWQVVDQVDTDAMVSVKVLRSDGRVFGQVDHRPVLDAYPTTAWRKGEIVTDTYAVPLFLGITPSDYAINVTLYDANSGSVIGQHDVQKIALGTDVAAPRTSTPNIAYATDEDFSLSLAGDSLDVWKIAQTTDADFGIFSLVGYSLDVPDNVTVRPGDALPLTLLWRSGSNKLADKLLVRMWLEDAKGQTVASRDTPLSVGFPPFQWQAHAFVRDWPMMRVPANVANGKYSVKVAISRDNQLLGPAFLPFHDTVVDLGQIEVKNREHVMSAPLIKHSLEATFDKNIRLLGYDVAVDAQQRTVRLTLDWRALGLIDTPYTVFVHLLDGGNNVQVSGDSEPGNGEFPTSSWLEDEYISDVHTLTLPPDLPKDSYQIEIGVYDPATGERLKTADGQDHLILTSIQTP